MGGNIDTGLEEGADCLVFFQPGISMCMDMIVFFFFFFFLKWH